MNITGKTFLVTGGASGLGEGAARALAAAGGNVIVADMNAERGQVVAQELGAQAKFAACDITDEASVLQAIGAATESFGGLHGVVNCAGVAMAQRIVDKRGPHSLEVFSLVIKVNLIGTFNVLRLAAATMMKQEPTDTGERGVIINTASIAAFDGQIGQAAYTASKGGVVALTLPAAREMARYGIRIVTIAPGTFDTPMLALLPQEVRASLAAQVPFPSRFGRPDEFAALAWHIIENEMINGETIRLDGAIHMAPK